MTRIVLTLLRRWPLVGDKLYGLWSQASTNLQGTIENYEPQLRGAGQKLITIVAGAGGGNQGSAVPRIEDRVVNDVAEEHRLAEVPAAAQRITLKNKEPLARGHQQRGTLT